MPKKVLTIAGSDASGGAGQLADLKIFEEFGVYGLVALSCVVTMDPYHQFSPTVHELDTTLLQKQCETAFVDNDLTAVKTGMLVSEEKIKYVGQLLKKHKQKNIVIDPVMICKQGDDQFNLKNAIINYLLPVSTITTPNLLEAQVLSNIEIKNIEDMKKAAQIIYDYGCKNIVIKGGSRLDNQTAIDVLYDGNNFITFEKEIVTSNNNHGAGCSFAAAITAALALEYDIKEAVRLAKDFVYSAIENGFMANHYVGHVLHGAYNNCTNRFTKN